ncbi:MAG: TetR/AcrR family transcriptional regulator [Ilumatobacteraceae bacterium]|nr:TetR/AcrR family transcriptional regulator [Ilumatobacteraceae bacterium]
MAAPRHETRPDPRIEQSRRKVLDATIDLLVTTQPTNVTIEAIAAKSRVSKATIYRHWPSRDNILVDAINAHTSQYPTPRTDLPFDDAISVFISDLIDAFSDPYRAAAHEALLILSRHHPTFAELHQRAHETIVAAVDALVQHGITHGRIAPRTDSNTVTAQLVGPFLYAYVESTRTNAAFIASVIDGVLHAHRPDHD